MGRQEKPLDPAAGPVQGFAFALRKLRQDAGGVTYRAMAREVEYSAATLAQAATGEKLPSLPVTLAYVTACGGDPEEWEECWRQARAEDLAEPAADDDAVPPYMGLQRFGTEDQERFFGRGQLTGELVEVTLARRLVAVVGASGSGKSSLLRAGLVPVLQAGGGRDRPPAVIRVCTPGSRPAAVHAHLFTPKEGTGDTVVVIDQFEEVFTLCREAAEREAFVELVLSATEPGSRLRVVIAVRADFFGRCAAHRGLAAGLQGATVLVPPMDARELREAIVKPAATAGLLVERDLTARLLYEVGEEPGALPLLSHVLLETWRRRRSRALTQDAYEAAGGLHGAIAQTAEALYTRFTREQQEHARRILLRLIAPGEGTPDTRRPADHDELHTNESDDASRVLQELAQARLVTLEERTVQLAHEALITAWPRLRDWIETDRERLRLHRRLTEAATTWEDLARDPGALYRGTRLATAREAFTAAEALRGLTDLEAAFLHAGIAAHEHERQAAARTTQRLRSLVGALAVFLVLALVATVLAFSQRESALAAQNLALSRQLAAQSAAMRETDADLAALLAVHAYRTSPTREALTSLYAAGASFLRHRLTGHRDMVSSVTFSPDGRSLASGSFDGSVRVWDASTGRSEVTLTEHSATSLAFSPDSRSLLARREDGAVWLRDVATGKPQAVLSKPPGGVNHVAFDSQGRALSLTHSGRIWDVSTGRPRVTLRGSDSLFFEAQLALSPDGRTVATGHRKHTVRLWDLATGHLRNVLASTGTETVAITSPLTFSPDGRTLATASDGGAVQLWDVRHGRVKALLAGHSDVVTSVAFSPDGHTLATGSNDNTARLWNVRGGHTKAVLTGHTDDVTSVAFSPDGHTLATGSDDDTVRLWNVPPPPIKVLTEPGGLRMTSAAFSPDGRTLVTGSEEAMRGAPGTKPRAAVRTWALTAKQPRSRALLTGQEPVRAVAYNSGGTALAIGGHPATSRLWDTATGKTRAALARSVEYSGAMAFSPDGHTLATDGGGGGVSLWDAATGKVLATFGRSHPAWSVAFSPDGRTLAVGGLNNTVRVWDVRTRRLKSTLATPDERSRTQEWSGQVTSLAFSPDGRLLATGAHSRARLWDMKTQKIHATLTEGGGEALGTVAFSPDGRTLATGHDGDGRVQLWDVTTGYLRATFTGHAQGVSSVAFSPDGRVLASASRDGTVQLWNPAIPGPKGTIGKICRAIGRDLTRKEHAAYLPSQDFTPTCHG